MLKYYDAAATTPTNPLVVEAMLPYFTEIYGNPSSSHEFGKQSRAAVEKARKQIAELLNVFPDEVIFTSGATEAINLGIFGYWIANRSKGNHIITVATEHAAVLNTCNNLEQYGVEITRLSVNQHGQIDFNELLDSMRSDTLLVAIMHVNNETGVIHDLRKIGEFCAQRGVAFFTDATQALGHIETDYSAPEISMIALSGHKFGGPKGIGALVKKRKHEIQPILHGGGQESGLRPGTLSTPLIVGLGKIAEITSTNLVSILNKLEFESKKLEHYLEKQFKATVIVPSELRSPHIIPVCINDTDAQTFLRKVYETHKIMASDGSACSSGTLQNSHVIRSMFGPTGKIDFVRFSFF
jgi:cysteine desulfurase